MRCAAGLGQRYRRVAQNKPPARRLAVCLLQHPVESGRISPLLLLLHIGVACGVGGGTSCGATGGITCGTTCGTTGGITRGAARGTTCGATGGITCGAASSVTRTVCNLASSLARRRSTRQPDLDVFSRILRRAMPL